MPKLWIDNRPVEVPDGTTVLAAARKLGIDIPALCYLQGHPANTSCMCCVVQIDGQADLVPACATVATEGMRVSSETDEVRAARRTALELLLSDHLGDCIGPCQSACPAGMDIPRMIRHIAAGDLKAAIATVKARIALPAALGRICPAPCEKACRRGRYDQPVAIKLLKRHAADADLADDEPYLPPRRPPSGKRVAIIGAGPAGLAAAYYLLTLGHGCTVFDDHDRPGGMLRYGVEPRRLPRKVLEAEIDIIRQLGAEFRMRTLVGEHVSLEELRTDFDAVFVAVGELRADDAEQLGLSAPAGRLRADPATFQTEVQGVFAGGDAIGRRKSAVRSVAHGHGAAVAIDQYLTGRPLTGTGRPFTTRMGRLDEEELRRLVALASPEPRASPAGRTLAGEDAPGLSDAQAHSEAARCLHCDCRKAESCKLRRYAALYAANPKRHGDQRRRLELHAGRGQVIYEPGKCIDCGLCVQITARAGEALGLTFVGRGFDVRVAVPFGRELDQALQKVAAECVRACPTGALAFKMNRASQ